MKNREMLQHLPAEVSTELSLNYLVLTLKHHVSSQKLAHN